MEKLVVKVNGKSYDAVSGRRIDDVIAPVKHAKPQQPVVHHTEKPVAVVPKPAAHQPASRAVNHAKAHTPQHASTLMRHAVKRPEPGLKKQIHPQHQLAHTDAHTIPVRHSVQAVDAGRLHRATKVEKHDQVRKFHTPQQVPVTFTHVPVRNNPQETPAGEPPIAPPPLPTNKPVDVFEQAIENASHYVDLAARKTHLKKKARRHVLSMSAGTLALLIIAGFALYQNSPGVQIKVAGIRAGVATATPNFAASGFAYNGAKTDESRLVIGLEHDGARYQLVEQATNLSSEQMIQHVSAVDASGYQNYEVLSAGASTVYRLGDSQATWVKDGVWYNVHGQKALSDQQIQSLVQNT